MLIIVLMCSASSPLHADTYNARVIVVIADYLSIKDLQSAGPSIQKVVDNGAVALVNTGIYKKKPHDAGFITSGAGTRAMGPDVKYLFSESDEIIHGAKASDSYEFQTGYTAPDQSVVCLGLARILNANSDVISSGGSIGLLGDTFHSAGLKTAVVGNSDTPGRIEHRASLIAMDSKGIVDSGVIDSSVVKSSQNSPCGLTDDTDAILHHAVRLSADHGLVVIELGDTARTEWYRPRLSDAAYAYHRTRNIESLDSFIGKLLPVIDQTGASLIVYSLERVKYDNEKKSNLTPIILYKKNGSRGVLSSATTRAHGVISNIDIAPTILKSAGIDVPGFVLGRPANIQLQDKPLTYLDRVERVAVMAYSRRIPVLAGIALVLILAATASELLLYRNSGKSGILKALQYSFLFFLSLPASLLMINRLDVNNLIAYIVLLITADLFVIGVSGLFLRIFSSHIKNKPYAMLGSILTLTSAFIMADVLTGAKFLRWSILSCDYITGIRYYGLGNEYMGILIGMALFGTLFLVKCISNGSDLIAQSRISWRPAIGIIALWFVFLTVTVGYPRIGANVGGLLTAIAAFGTALIILSGKKLRPFHGIILAAFAILVIAIFSVIDVSGKNIGTSHLGRSLTLAKNYGLDSLWVLVSRKVIMHIGILKLPQSYYPMILGLPFLVMYGVRFKSEMAQSVNADTINSILLPAMITGMIVAFFFNDSGIVPASLIFAVYAVSSIYLRLGEKT
ncbi:MAG: hypothetical protein ACYC27_08685 [Armatimonadota bacterium]